MNCPIRQGCLISFVIISTSSVILWFTSYSADLESGKSLITTESQSVGSKFMRFVRIHSHIGTRVHGCDLANHLIEGYMDMHYRLTSSPNFSSVLLWNPKTMIRFSKKFSYEKGVWIGSLIWLLFELDLGIGVFVRNCNK